MTEELVRLCSMCLKVGRKEFATKTCWYCKTDLCEEHTGMYIIKSSEVEITKLPLCKNCYSKIRSNQHLLKNKINNIINEGIYYVSKIE